MTGLFQQNPEKNKNAEALLLSHFEVSGKWFIRQSYNRDKHFQSCINCSILWLYCGENWIMWW